MNIPVFNPQELIRYINGMKEQCNTLQSSQAKIEVRFSRLEESWCDNIYALTLEQLSIVSKELSRLYGGLSTTVLNAARHVNRINEIQGYSLEKVSEIPLAEFRSKLLERDGKMGSFNTVNIVNLDAMRDFEKALGTYIEETQNSLQRIKREYINIGQNRVWDAPQYRQFGEIIDDVSRKMQSNLQTLLLTKMIIAKKRAELEEEYSKRI